MSSLSSNFEQFLVMENNGSLNNPGFSNHCMWLAIICYLAVCGIEISLSDIRLIGSGNGARINGPKEQFDTDQHLQALKNVADSYNLQIHLYVSDPRTNHRVISKDPHWIIGNHHTSSVVSIVSYGSHFALITCIGSKNLYSHEFESQSMFVPNIELALGKQIEPKSPKDMEEIDNLLKVSVRVHKEISDITQQIEKTTNNLAEFESSLEPIELTDVDLQTVIVTSFQEHKMSLEKILADLNKNHNEMKSILVEIETAISNLIQS
jgi:hypothetical protein